MLLGLAVFAAVYALLVVPRLGRKLREFVTGKWGRFGSTVASRPGITAAGAMLVILLFEVSPQSAWQAIDWRTLALLTGMMLLVAALDAAAVFTFLATRLVRWLQTPTRLIAGSMAAVAVLSALVLNDAIVLLFTPVLVRAARAMNTDPAPVLIAEAIAANLGSVATPVGNPQNAFLAANFHITFARFVQVLSPLAVIGLTVGIIEVLAFFRRGLRARPAGSRNPNAMSPSTTFQNPRLLGIALGGVIAAFAAFLLGPMIGVPLWWSALGTGLVVLALTPAARTAPTALLRRVDPGILVFFVGLFVLLETVKQADLLTTLSATRLGSSTPGLIFVTALVSNLVSNVPAVLLLAPLIQNEQQALVMAASSTYAGNATFLGSAATVIVAETARREGAEFSVLRFTLIGFPIAAATLALTWLYFS